MPPQGITEDCKHIVMTISKHCFMKLYESFVLNQCFGACIKLLESRDFSNFY